MRTIALRKNLKPIQGTYSQKILQGSYSACTQSCRGPNCQVEPCLNLVTANGNTRRLSGNETGPAGRQLDVRSKNHCITLIPHVCEADKYL